MIRRAGRQAADPVVRQAADPVVRQMTCQMTCQMALEASIRPGACLPPGALPAGNRRGALSLPRMLCNRLIKRRRISSLLRRRGRDSIRPARLRGRDSIHPARLRGHIHLVLIHRRGLIRRGRTHPAPSPARTHPAPSPALTHRARHPRGNTHPARIRPAARTLRLAPTRTVRTSRDSRICLLEPKSELVPEWA